MKWPSFIASNYNDKVRFCKDKKILYTLEYLNLGFYFGITWNDKVLYVASRKKDKILKLTKDNIIFNNDKIILDGDKINFVDYMPSITLSHPITRNAFDIHQILFYDDKLFVCCTGKNFLDIHYFQDDKIVDNKKINFSDLRGKFCYINSVFCGDGKIYVCEKDLASVEIFDINTLQCIDNFIIPNGKYLHNLYVKKNFIFTCSSGTGQILRYDMNSKKTEVVFDVCGVKDLKDGATWTRGLCFCNDCILLSVSLFRERKLRFDDENYVLMLDNNFNFIDYMLFPKQSGPCSCMRVVEQIDYAHNSYRFPLLKEIFGE